MKLKSIKKPLELLNSLGFVITEDRPGMLIAVYKPITGFLIKARLQKHEDQQFKFNWLDTPEHYIFSPTNKTIVDVLNEYILS